MSVFKLSSPSVLKGNARWSIARIIVSFFRRYISIIHPRKSSSVHRRTRLHLTFIGIWSAGFLFALPNLYLLKLHEFHHPSKYFICGLSDHWNDSKFLLIYKYTESILFFFLPALIQVNRQRQLPPTLVWFFSDYSLHDYLSENIYYRSCNPIFLDETTSCIFINHLE